MTSKIETEKLESNDPEVEAAANYFNNLTAEEAGVLGITEETPEETPAPTQSPREEKEVQTPKETQEPKEVQTPKEEEEVKTPEQVSLDNLLAQKLIPQEELAQETPEADPVEQLRIENEQLKQTMYNQAVAQNIDGLLHQVSPKEADTLVKGVEQLLSSPETSMVGSDLPAEKRAALLVSLARGNSYDALMKIKQEESNKETETKQKYEELITDSAPKQGTPKSQEDVLNELRARAAEGDMVASDKLIALTSPEIDAAMEMFDK